MSKRSWIIGVVGVLFILFVVAVIIIGSRNKLEKCFIPKTAFFAEDNGAKSFVEEIGEMNGQKEYYTNIEVDSKGNVYLTITKEQKENHKKLLKKNVEKYLEMAKEAGISLEVGDSYGKITWEGNLETQIKGSSFLGICMYYMGMYQCICEGVGENWAVDVTILNKDTQELVRQFSFPKEELQLDGDDW